MNLFEPDHRTEAILRHSVVIQWTSAHSLYRDDIGLVERYSVKLL